MGRKDRFAGHIPDFDPGLVTDILGPIVRHVRVEGPVAIDVSERRAVVAPALAVNARS